MKTLLYALLPARARFDAFAALRQRLARADALAPGARHELAATDAFQWTGGTLPAAALVREHVAHDAGAHVWVCADLAHVDPDMTGVRMLACGSLDLSPDEADALAQPLRPLFGDHGMRLETTLPTRWQLRLAPSSPLPPLDPPGEVLGDDLIDHLPAGDDGRRWRQLLNEAQVLLHQHPVNRARARQGKSTANSLWFWGAGALPQTVRSDLRHVYADDVLPVALAARAHLRTDPLADFDPERPVAADTLLDLGQADAAAAMRQVLRPLDAGHVHTLVLHFADGERYRLRRFQRWRFWRHGP